MTCTRRAKDLRRDLPDQAQPRTPPLAQLQRRSSDALQGDRATVVDAARVTGHAAGMRQTRFRFTAM